MNSLLKGMVTSFAIAMSPSVVFGEEVSGNVLWEACDSDQVALNAFCIGYIVGYSEGTPWGVFQVLTVLDPEITTAEANSRIGVFLKWCAPQNASNEQLTDVVLKYLRDKPQIRHQSARHLIFLAYAEAFPC